jgi:protein TonB
VLPPIALKYYPGMRQPGLKRAPNCGSADAGIDCNPMKVPQVPSEIHLGAPSRSMTLRNDVDMSPQSPSAGQHAAWAGDRHILVPPDIVAIPRRSPVRARTRTPWRPRAEGELTTRGGGREWFAEQRFVEPRQAEIRAACGTSMTAHASCLIGLVLAALTQSDPMPPLRVGPSLVMPAMMAVLPAIGDTSMSEAATRAAEPSAPKVAPTLAPPPPPPPLGAAPVAAPLEAPSDIAPETGNESGAEGVEGGVPGGIDGGAGGGTPGGVAGGRSVAGSGSGTGSTGPLRLGPGIEQPRKIKDVRPVYPPGALSDQARGTVVVEATVSVDGKVEGARVIRSIPQLDEAALDAVRQWEFLPGRLNGVPVAVIITVVVNFAIF